MCFSGSGKIAPQQQVYAFNSPHQCVRLRQRCCHRLLHRLTRRAVQALESNPPLLYSFSAHFPGHGYPRLANRDDPAHLIVNVEPVLERVIAAAQCHRTQHALFVRRQTKRSGRKVTVAEIVRTTPLEGVRRQLPDAEGTPDDIFTRRLQP